MAGTVPLENLGKGNNGGCSCIIPTKGLNLQYFKIFIHKSKAYAVCFFQIRCSGV